jgi:hypothetical protein
MFVNNRGTGSPREEFKMIELGVIREIQFWMGDNYYFNTYGNHDYINTNVNDNNSIAVSTSPPLFTAAS